MKLARVLSGIALLAVLPVLLQLAFGYGGHDFALHVPAWIDLSDLWHAGQVLPGWAPKASYLLGSPSFCYYPPLSLGVGAALAMLLPVWTVPAAFVWLAFFVSGVSMYLASEDFVAGKDRWKAALLYMVSPYLITTSLVRFAAAEALTMAWLPLLILFFYRAVWNRQLRATLLLGGLLGLTWITNVPASIVLLYSLGFAVLALALSQRSIWPLAALFLGECIAAALACFYLIPTWLEQGWIHKDSVLRYAYKGFFLFAPVSQQPLRFFRIGSWIFAFLGTALIALYAWSGRRGPEKKSLAWTCTSITLVCFLFQLPLSDFLWKHLPELMFAGFPYRFMAPIGVMLPLMLLARNTPRTWLIPSYALIALMALFPIREYRSEMASRVAFNNRVQDWKQNGYRGWTEFLPAAVQTLPERQAAEPIATVDPVSIATCHLTLLPPRTGDSVLHTDSTTGCQVRVATYYFPYWRALDESGSSLPTSKDSLGRLLFTAPAGNHTIRLEFKATSPGRTVSLWISLVSLCLLTLALAGSRWLSSRLHPGGALAAESNARPQQPIPN